MNARDARPLRGLRRPQTAAPAIGPAFHAAAPGPPRRPLPPVPTPPWVDRKPRPPWRPLVVALAAIVVAGIAVPATTRVEPPAPVAETVAAHEPAPPPAAPPTASHPESPLPRPATRASAPRPAPRPTTVATVAPPTPVQAPRPRPTTVEPRRLPTTAAPAPARPAVTRPAPKAAPRPAAAPVHPTAGGGYVLAGGHFRVAADGRQILEFTLESACAGAIVLPAIPVDASGAFSYAGQPAGTPPGTVVSLAGRFVSALEARGSTTVGGGACRSETAAFVARLS